MLHLDTTAHGVEDVYNVQKANNPARHENAQQARDLDDKVGAGPRTMRKCCELRAVSAAQVFECWKAHPNVVKLSNLDGFQEKLDAGTEAVLDMIKAKKNRILNLRALQRDKPELQKLSLKMLLRLKV